MHEMGRNTDEYFIIAWICHSDSFKILNFLLQAPTIKCAKSRKMGRFLLLADRQVQRTIIHGLTIAQSLHQISNISRRKV